MSTATLSKAEHSRRTLTFLRHLGGMTAAMFWRSAARPAGPGCTPVFVSVTPDR